MSKDLIYFTQYMYDYHKLIGGGDDNFLFATRCILDSEEYLACQIAFIMGKVNSFEKAEQIINKALDPYEDDKSIDGIMKDIEKIYLSGVIK